jgi:hypothetical protein
MHEGDGRCYTHGFEAAENRCRHCGHEYCSECLVYAFGSNKPPYCISCALAASGVRSNAAQRPALSRREIRKYEKERRRALKAQATPSPADRVAIEPVAWTPPPAKDDTGEEDPFAWADRPDAGQRVPF